MMPQPEPVETVGNTAGYTIPPPISITSDIPTGEQVRPPICSKCGDVTYDGERIKEKIYCRKCLRGIVEYLIGRIQYWDRLGEMPQDYPDWHKFKEELENIRDV